MDKIKVFVADDSVVARNMLIRLLSGDAGIEVVGEAGTGQSSILLVESVHPDVVILEAAIGGGMGIGEIAQEMRQSCPQVKIILSVDISTSLDVVGSAKYGVSDFVRKPYNKANVLRAVRNAAL
jgi:DNA-binding NarL/FixJ family response regulator